jgi:exopolysaccharide biosynthesis polyprenyl glycosylphosphotransferase
MIREYNYVLRQISIWLDLMLGALAFLLAFVFKRYGPWYYFYPGLFRLDTPLTAALPVLLLVPAVTVLALAHNGYYGSHRIYSFPTIAWRISLSCLESLLICYALISIGGRVLDPNYDPSRGMIVLTVLFLFMLLLIKTCAMDGALKSLRRRGYNFRTMLLVGSGASLREFIRLLRSHPLWGFRIEGILSDSAREAATGRIEDVPVVGSLEQIFDVLKSQAIDEVVFLPSRTPLEELAPYLEGCEEMGVRATLSLNFHQPLIATPTFERVEDVPLVSYSPIREMSWALMLKYAFDRAAATILLTLASPFMALAALAIRLTSKPGEPVFYGQTRAGLNGREFTLWKFRSMRVGADAEVEQLRDRNEVDGPVFKMRNDPRVTSVGRWLRRWSIDELPQLYNVLRGDMSLVGPRPPIPAEVAQYDRWQRRRLSMKPGITCLWQVMGRSQLSFDAWMKLDLQYIDNWSLLLDFKILLKTVVVVLTGTGAM